MTNDKGEGHEKAQTLWNAIERHMLAPDAGSHNWLFYMVNDLVAPYLKSIAIEAHAAGRREAIAEVVPVLEFYGDIDNWDRHPDWYHEYRVMSEYQDDDETLMEEGDYKIAGKRARALLAKLKAECGEKE